MNLKEQLCSVKTIIQTLLETDIKARSCDNHLYLRVIRIFAIGKGIDLNSLTVPDFLENMKDYNFPAFETVRRTRQKLQAENPALSANDFTAKKRAENETIYNAFAKEGA